MTMEFENGFFFIATLSALVLIAGVAGENATEADNQPMPTVTTARNVETTPPNNASSVLATSVHHLLDLLPIPEDLGKSCTKKEDCKNTNSRCFNGTCQCLENNVLASNGKECLEMVTEFGEKCSEDVQCSPLKDTYGEVVCVNLSCRCDPVRTKLYKEACLEQSHLGGKCIQHESCSVKNSECDQEVCVCSDNYVPDADGMRCLPILKEMNATCEMDAQCNSYLGDGALCLQNKCACLNSFHFNGDVCVENKPLGSDCKKDVDCLIPVDVEPGNRRTCFNGTCSCLKNFKELKKDNICDTVPSSAARWDNFWLTTLILSLVINFLYKIPSKNCV
ncbi:uncharacterized protein DDB_G0272512-like isoform X2 [Cimex lectularius]|uniref:EB domain-containing protein n=1 Tax=Cimex lectularius TaxID=79782 RepID=A0A8I6RBZ2_CIMLE|nr:uncharacterized protein DDB_G0272512-like isoform X2 [Cimex lectularius]